MSAWQRRAIGSGSASSMWSLDSTNMMGSFDDSISDSSEAAGLIGVVKAVEEDGAATTASLVGDEVEADAEGDEDDVASVDGDGVDISGITVDEVEAVQQ